MTAQPSGLSWERSGGEPVGVGVCLSGGGLRAASFGLGVIQALQQERQLMYGPDAARYLAAVSGGSYVAATFAINAQHLALKEPVRAQGCGNGSGAVTGSGSAENSAPLAPGSPEEEHILDHGRYLVDPLLPTIARFALLIVLNLAALVVLFVWTGTMVADAATLNREYGAVVPFQPWVDGQPLALSALGVVASILLTVHGLYSDSRLWRYVLPVPGFAGIFLFSGPAVAGLDASPWFGSNNNWLLLVFCAIASMSAAAGVSLLLGRWRVTGAAPAVADWAQVVLVRVAGASLTLWSSVIWYRVLRPVFDDHASTREQVTAGLVLFASLIGGAVFGYVPDRASLHREYRDRIRSCFGVQRDQSSVVEIPSQVLLSSIRPSENTRLSWPQLLICATANVPNRASGGRRRAYAPFVFTHDICGVPGTEAMFPTAQLELGRCPAGLSWRRKEPLITLFTAVATTGAAVSPSMGRHTMPSARPIIAALNLRLGRWYPNPFSRRMRDRVAKKAKPGRFHRDGRMGPGYDELIPEMLGISGPEVYLSDGGHYDNLGLLALIRARCSQIWCVDSSPDPLGVSAELTRVLAVATAELNVTSDIDISLFGSDDAGMYGETFARGTLTFASGDVAELIVLKLGLAAGSPSELTGYCLSDKGFPHHKTTQQWYSRSRITAYRDLGRDTATRAIRSLPAVATKQARG